MIPRKTDRSTTSRTTDVQCPGTHNPVLWPGTDPWKAAPVNEARCALRTRRHSCRRNELLERRSRFCPRRVCGPTAARARPSRWRLRARGPIRGGHLRLLQRGGPHWSCCCCCTGARGVHWTVPGGGQSAAAHRAPSCDASVSAPAHAMLHGPTSSGSVHASTSSGAPCLFGLSAEPDSVEGGLNACASVRSGWRRGTNLGGEALVVALACRDVQVLRAS